MRDGSFPRESRCQPLGAGRRAGGRQRADPLALLAGTGSLTEDMERQLQANSTRIDVLEQENAKLSAALAKMKAAAEQGALKVRLRPRQGRAG